MAEIIFGIVGAAVGIAGTIFGFVGVFRNKKTDDKTEGEHDGAVRADLGYIKKGIDGIEHRLEKQETQYVDVIRQLTEVEASTKQAHKRLDKLEKYHQPN